MDRNRKVSYFFHPNQLWTPADILREPSRIPKLKGLYGWYFAPALPAVPFEGCVRSGNWTLLYVGIAGQNAQSKEDLRTRIKEHLKGKARGSTLRLSLGCLLQHELDLIPQRYGCGKRIWFGEIGEARLTQWMRLHARVAWIVDDEPWEIEVPAIESYSLPLNIEHNAAHQFSSVLKAIRKACKQEAKYDSFSSNSDSHR